VITMVVVEIIALIVKAIVIPIVIMESVMV
jgi:hypothetical protein